MLKTDKFLLLILIQAILTILPCSAEEIDLLSIPLESTEAEYNYTIKVVTPDGSATAAILALTNIEDNQNSFYIIQGAKTLHLPEAKYSGVLISGSRRMSLNISFSLPGQKDETGTFTINPFINVEPTGWMMIDPFYSPSSSLPAEQLNAATEALEIRAVFTPVLPAANNAGVAALKSRASTLYAPVQSFLNKEYGEVISYSSNSDDKPSPEPLTVNHALYPLLASLSDSNSLTAISPVIFSRQRANISKSYSEEFIFDTISGPLYDLLLLDDFATSIKIWHTLLNLGYRLPAIYTGGNNLYRNSTYPYTKMYVKIPRKMYSLKYLHSALKNGQSILSNGPFIRLFVESTGSKDSNHKTGLDNTDWINGHSLKIGDLGFTSDNTRNIYAEAFASSDPQDSLKVLELIYNGKVIQRKVADKEGKALNTLWKVVLDKPGWLQLRYISKDEKFHALTNPIYISDYNTQPPPPVLARTEVSVFDKKTGKPLEAKIRVENFGITIDSSDIFKHPIIIQTPSTANIRVEAEGYRSESRSVYLDGGGAAYIANLRKKNLLLKALSAKVTYGYLQKALANSKLVFRLEPEK